MKSINIIIATAIPMCLLSCHAKKATVSESADSLQYADTTKTEIAQESYRSESTDSIKIISECELNESIEFVDGGGSISIDSVGNIILEGVKNIRSSGKGSLSYTNAGTDKKEVAKGRIRQYNGFNTDRAKSTKQSESKNSPARWYETLFIRVGQGVCIAALVWALFLYLRKKK